MSSFRGMFVPDAMFFFTVRTERHAPILTTARARGDLKRALVACRARWQFRIDALVVLPDHLHMIWTLPPGDANSSLRWTWIRTEFSRSWTGGDQAEAPRGGTTPKGRRPIVWQGPFWEHRLRDENDLERHCDYIHYNPVKHGLVTAPKLWRYSSFHRFVKHGVYATDWAGTEAARSPRACLSLVAAASK